MDRASKAKLFDEQRKRVSLANQSALGSQRPANKSTQEDKAKGMLKMIDSTGNLAKMSS